jgi:hypothetical protein
VVRGHSGEVLRLFPVRADMLLKRHPGRMSEDGKRAATARERFAERGFGLKVEQRDMSDEIARQGYPDAPSRRHTHWADLVSLRNGEVVQRGYGSGLSEENALARAHERWLQEQGDDPPRR